MGRRKGQTVKTTRNWSGSQDAAHHLAERIFDFWSARGVEIDVEVVAGTDHKGEPVFGVRTNLIGGKPK
jgi:hypothetical protein